MENKFDELVSKLKEIFQLDKPELDFGIYRILHARSAEIKDFLENRLKTKVQETLKAHSAADAQGVLEAARQAAVNALGPAAIETDGTVNPAFATTPAGQQYVAAMAAFDAAQGTLKNESEVYSHLLDFFKCYYEDGDFVSKRRYKEGKYAIPYEGEEVKLHWANADQYYTKSGENFTNYSFTVDGHSVAFKLLTAETAKDNVKDNDGERRFVLWDPAKKESVCDGAAPVIDDEESALLESLPDKFLEEKDGKLVIYFQYLKLPKAKKGATEKTDKNSLNTAAVEQIKQALAADNALALKYHKLLEPVSKDDKRLFVEKQLADYTAKNTSDYFIHKDLKGFLTRELDFYVKNEMMHLDRIDEAQTIKDIEANLRIIQAFRAIALVLIDFMAQLEEFQKKLYLKKKFVTECEYCITMDRVPEGLRSEVQKNKKQLKEWGELNTDVDPKTKDMTALDARMVDTRNFRLPDGSNPFKDKLLKQIDNLDDACDGLLIHADNFQALRFLKDRYCKSIRTVFIDPPYNTEDSEGENDFLYKDCYQHSSWASMMSDRLASIKSLLTANGIFAFTLSDEELKVALSLFDAEFSSSNRLGIIEWNSTKSVTNKALISMGHTHIPIYANSKEYYVKHRVEFRLEDSEDGFANPDNDPRGKWKADPFQVGGERPDQLYPITNPKTGEVYRPNAGNSWKNKFSVFQKLLADNRIVFGVSGEAGPQRKRFWTEAKERGKVSKTWWDEEETTTNGTQTLISLFGRCPFKNPKPVGLMRSLLALCSRNGGVVLDYFGGSGTTAHAVIELNRLDERKRKYILAEMGDHFETVLMRRIKKVVYSPDWKKGRPVSFDKGISHCFKYLSLESYEDTLNNLELTRTAQQQQQMMEFGGDEYLLKYMLDLESRGSVISTDDFRKPFDYKLKIAYESSGAAKEQKIDLVETFNYLIGLKVEQRIAAYSRGYVCVTGTLPNGESAIVFWRDCDVIDAEKLNAELAKIAVDPAKKTATFDVIYVNGDHAVQNAAVKSVDGAPQLKVRQIENEFLEKMFEET